ncbi:MAG: hypothetical protein M1815_002059 [Lichina confinis]|nr:MAG: hypothetical protein M1815_002059 [Lichina confinis]
MGWFTPSPTRVYGNGSYYGSSSSNRHNGSSGRRQYYASSSSSSHYKRRPRDGYIERVVYQLRRLLRRLITYARDNPVRVFMIVVMPLITGGALQQVLRQFGIRLPMGLSRGAGSMFGSSGYSSYSRRGGGYGDFGGSGSIEGLMKVVQAFI